MASAGPAGRYVPKIRAFPKLYNAKRQVKVSRGLLPAQLDHFKKNPLSEEWRKQVSKDVEEFLEHMRIEENGLIKDELLPQEKAKLFQDPVRYFSRPHNVPDNLRKQIYFPNFSVTLMRTPNLGPRYAQFEVPLWFGKLDLKSYLKNLYNVEVNHIRSYVIHVKQDRKTPANRYSRGQGFQPAFKKKMTVELVEPFVWPKEPTEAELDGSDHEKKRYWTSSQAAIDEGRRSQEEFPSEPNEKHRRSIAEQARALLAGETTWKPTWQEIPPDVRLLQGKNTASTSLSEPVPHPSLPMR